MAHAVVYRHRGYRICTKSPATADDLDYFIDDSNFRGQRYKLVQDAVDAIDKEVTRIETSLLHLCSNCILSFAVEQTFEDQSQISCPDCGIIR